VQAMANSLPASATKTTILQTQIPQVQADLTAAKSAFQSGNFKTGISDIQQAMQLLQQIVTEIRAATPHA